VEFAQRVFAGVPPAGSYYGFFFDGTTWTKA
jgi:hypothetical protein